MSELDLSELDDDEVYEVSDEMLASYARSTPLQRLEWLEQMRTFSYRAVTDETRARWRERRDRARGLIPPRDR